MKAGVIRMNNELEERVEFLERRVEFLGKLIKQSMGEGAWEYHLNGTPIGDTAHDVGNPECGSVN